MTAPENDTIRSAAGTPALITIAILILMR